MKYSRKKREPGKIKLRIILVGVFFSLLYIVIAGRVVYLQVFRGEMLAGRAYREYYRTCVTSGKRGTVFDRNHNEMAVTVDAMSIGLHPSEIPDVNQVLPELARAVNIGVDDLGKKLNSNRSFVWLKRKMTDDEVAAVRQIGLPAKAIEYIPAHKRVYPNNSLAAQLIGFTGVDGIGMEGIEYEWEKELCGNTVSRTVLMDARKRYLGNGDEQAGKADGNDVILTIDSAIQYITEAALEEAVVSAEAISGMAIVMDPQTGEILAMANYPYFNLNNYRQYSRDLWRNRIVTDAFEPGSIMKVFLAAGSIESGLCTPDSVFFCEEGEYLIDGHCIHDSHENGWLTMREIIKISSNIGAVKISERIGRKNLWETLRRFGFDSRPDIACPGGTGGLLSFYTQWTTVDTSAIAFGQGVSASAVQLVTAVSAIANGGLLLKPYVVSATTEPDGRIVQYRERKVIRRVISEQTAACLKEMMAEVTSEGGTGAKAAIDGYTVCGKTGTAQKLNEEGQYTDKDYVASFLGFAPFNNPRMAVLVVVNSPRKGYYGGIVAAPAFKKIVHEALNYFGVPPERKNTGENLMALVKQEAKR